MILHSITMNKLRAALQLRNPALAAETNHIVGKATPQLWHTYATFPSGTKHTPEHTDMVEKLAGWLLPDAIIPSLTDDEIALLIQACHFHDLGMSGTEADNLTIEGRDQVRREHAVSIGERIQTHWRAFGFPNETAAEVLAIICKGHRPKRENDEATWRNLPATRVMGPQRLVRIRLVSSIVYAADELHIGEDRAPKREEEFKEILSAESRRHWQRHQAVQGPVVQDGHLMFEGTVNCPALELDLRKALSKAFLAVRDLAQELARNNVVASVTPIRFTWNRRAIWNLLVTQVCLDMKPRARNDIVSEVLKIFRTSTEEQDSISELCEEQPPHFRFNSPTFDGDEKLQSDVRRQWDAGAEFKMEATYRESIDVLAQTFRDWVADVSQPFPFGITDPDLMFHYAETRVTVCFDQVVDRVWYRERRVVVRFRLLNRHEQYAIEREYWEDRKDEARVQLLDDLIKQAKSKFDLEVSTRGIANQLRKGTADTDTDIESVVSNSPTPPEF